MSHLGDIDAREVNTFPVAGTTSASRPSATARTGGGDQRANVPKGTAPDELTPANAEECSPSPPGIPPRHGPGHLGGHRGQGGRFGAYVSEVLPEGDASKPRTASLFKDMALERSPGQP